MEAGNINPSSDNLNSKLDPLNNKQQPASGLDQWNERLDENLEPESTGDELADEKARNFNESEGSGDQSDDI